MEIQTIKTQKKNPIISFLELITFKDVGSKIKKAREKAILNIVDSYNPKKLKEKVIYGK